MRKHSKEYDDYMKSDEWKAKRAERLKIDDNRCVPGVIGRYIDIIGV